MRNFIFFFCLRSVAPSIIEEQKVFLSFFFNIRINDGEITATTSTYRTASLPAI